MNYRQQNKTDTASLRYHLETLDTVQIETLCLDYFPEVYNKFSRGLRRDEMTNLLLDHCHRKPKEAVKLLSVMEQRFPNASLTTKRGVSPQEGTSRDKSNRAPSLHQSLQIILRTISVVTLIVSLGWMIFSPGFEPFIAILGSVATLIASFFMNNAASATLNNTEVTPNEPVIRAPDTVVEEQIISKKGLQSKIERVIGETAIVDHERLFGVDEGLKQLDELLSVSDGRWIVSLFGEGGIGKTALAYEAVKRFAAASGFTRVAWVSAKQRYFSISTGSQTLQDAKLQWADLIRQIADQLGIELSYARTMWLEDFRIGIKHLPNNEKCLIVVDNLETIEELSVIEYFDDPTNPTTRIVNPHKLLVTTRKSIVRQPSNIVEIPVSGLSPGSAYQFIRDLGKTSEAIHSATNEDLLPILNVTEGNPLLIKLIVRRFLYTHKSISLILDELQELGKSAIATDLRNYLYVQSLEELESRVGQNTAKYLMNAFCPRPAGDKLSYEELQRYSGIDDESFEKARALACDLSLVRVSGSIMERRYSIHSLLWEFTCGSP